MKSASISERNCLHQDRNPASVYHIASSFAMTVPLPPLSPTFLTSDPTCTTLYYGQGLKQPKIISSFSLFLKQSSVFEQFQDVRLRYQGMERLSLQRRSRPSHQREWPLEVETTLLEYGTATPERLCIH